MFRKFLHIFGKHYWTKWSEPKLNDVPFMAYLGWRHQERKCKICDVVESRAFQV